MKVMGNSGQQQAGQMKMPQAADAVSREIKNQIAAAQKRLQSVVSDTNLSAEQKMKKRQEIQKEICELQNQLRQHEIEMRREKERGAEEAHSVVEQRKNVNVLL